MYACISTYLYNEDVAKSQTKWKCIHLLWSVYNNVAIYACINYSKAMCTLALNTILLLIIRILHLWHIDWWYKLCCPCVVLIYFTHQLMVAILNGGSFTQQIRHLQTNSAEHWTNGKLLNVSAIVRSVVGINKKLKSINCTGLWILRIKLMPTSGSRVGWVKLPPVSLG